MRKLFIILSVSLIPFQLLAQSQVVKEDIEIIEDFQTINVNSRYTVYLKQSNETRVEVRALKEVMDISEFKIRDGSLDINIKREEKNRSIWEQIDDIKISPKLDVYVSMKDIQSLNVNGNGKIIAENSISSKELILTNSGSGTLDLDIKGKNLAIINSGSGLTKVTGYADSANVTLSGYGKIEAFKLDLKSAKATLTGSGDIEMNVKDNLKANVYGGGTILFKGNTKQVTKKEHGLGKVERTY
ncbi:head GIN domain-containing protein [Ekhidna sp.]|uniref:head GIN domain-containing protein n=1 Tax=Ekhidna sp. TaxID=2608089 RepID=UPI003B59920A